MKFRLVLVIGRRVWLLERRRDGGFDKRFASGVEKWTLLFCAVQQGFSHTRLRGGTQRPASRCKVTCLHKKPQHHTTTTTRGNAGLGRNKRRPRLSPPDVGLLADRNLRGCKGVRPVPSQDQETQQCSTASVTRFPECDDSPNLQVKDKHVNRHA